MGTQIPEIALKVKTEESPLVGGTFTHESSTKTRTGTFIVLAQWPMPKGHGICYCRRVGKKGSPVGPVIEIAQWSLLRGSDKA